MTTLRAVLIDDEVNCLQMLEWELRESCPNVEIVRTCPSGKAGLMAIKEEKPDVVFLDIEMPYLNGFEVLELVPSIDFDVIFTTAYDKFAVRAFKSSATDYLLKPIEADDLQKAVEKVVEKREQRIPTTDIKFLLQQLEDVKNNKVSKVALPTLEGVTFINTEEIICAESDKNYCYIFLTGDRKFFVSKSLKDLSDILDPTVFFRPHNSHLINLQYVKNYFKADGGYLVMENDRTVKISRSRKDKLFELLSM